MVTEQNKDDVIETLYRKGVTQDKSEMLSALKAMNFSDWDDNAFFDTVKALTDENLISIRFRDFVFFTLNGIAVRKRF